MVRDRKESPQQWRSAPRPVDWPKRRARVLRRDPQCTLRTHCKGDPSTECDHIGDPSDHSDDNLRGVCAPCHAHRTAIQASTARWANAPKRTRPTTKHPGLR